MAKRAKEPLSPTLTIIEQLTAVYAKARQAVIDRVSKMRAQVKTVEEKHLPSIRELAAAARDAHAQLEAAIVEHKATFSDPRTRSFHGIKVGVRKLVGKLQWEDDAKVVELIRKHFPEQSDVLVATVEKPVVKALEQLSVAELKKLGVTVEQDSDKVVIEAPKTEIEKFVDSLLDQSAEVISQ